jgi:hypothetical protein
MEKKELTFYWYPTNDSDGVNFETDKEYTIEKIFSILKEKNKFKINGFFINFGLPVGDHRFNRIVIEKGTNKILKIKEQQFFKVNYENYFSSVPQSVLEREFDFDDELNNHLDKIFKDNRSDEAKGGSLLKRFGVFNNDSNENN